ncbi:hypothetical protein GCM10010193_69910 [Kitasatospora atroaurantiaca]|uniref:hypothetical protein n=1 Tax=Kitasatospora atroaurantiaca TaxID=285545 RepID=UPI0011A1A00E|nr:hypothetical protein [Kitasatospora atroaurantiaca]
MNIDLHAAADRAATLCTCGAAASRCADCHGTGWHPGSALPRTECPACRGIGGERPHDWECEGLHVPLIADNSAALQPGGSLHGHGH